MLNCPECAGPTTVIDTRESLKLSALRRRRRCKLCDHRFTTFEVRAPKKVAAIINDSDALLNLIESVSKNLSAIRSVTDDQLLGEVKRRLDAGLGLRTAKQKRKSTEPDVTDPFKDID